MAIINNINLDLDKSKIFICDGKNFHRVISEKSIDTSVVAENGNQLLVDKNKDKNKISLFDGKEYINLICESDLNGDANNISNEKIKFKGLNNYKYILSSNENVPFFSNDIIGEFKKRYNFEFNINNYKIKATKIIDGTVEYYDAFPYIPNSSKDTFCDFFIQFDTGFEDYKAYLGIGQDGQGNVEIMGRKLSDGKNKGYKKLNYGTSNPAVKFYLSNVYLDLTSQTKLVDAIRYSIKTWNNSVDEVEFEEVDYTGYANATHKCAIYLRENPHMNENHIAHNQGDVLVSPNSYKGEICYNAKYLTDEVYGNPKGLRQTIMHEMGHSLNLADYPTHLPSIMEYSSSSYREKTSFPCPNDRYGVRTNYGVQNYDLNNLEEERIYGEHISFTFPIFEEDKFDENSDLIILGKVVNEEIKLIPIDIDEKSFAKYNVYDVEIEGVNKGNKKFGEIVKVKVPYNHPNRVELKIGDYAKFYLVEFERVPYSPINPIQGIEKI